MRAENRKKAKNEAPGRELKGHGKYRERGPDAWVSRESSVYGVKLKTVTQKRKSTDGKRKRPEKKSSRTGEDQVTGVMQSEGETQEKEKMGK